MLLKEVRVLTDLQVISESRETGVMCIRGTFQRAEEANHNQRIYPKAVLENCVKSLDEKLKGRELVGELDHPADGVVKLQNASHLITKLEWQGNDLIGEAEILPTPAGQIAKSLINAGVKIGISSRGMGTLSESARGAKIVNDDYKMITFDLVADPSTKGAYPSLAESKQHAIDFVEKVIKPAISEQAFVARLKKKLNEAKKENNPWAICTAQVGREDKAKYERCVNQVKNESTVDEGCGSKHSRRKGLKRMKRKMENSSREPLTLDRLDEIFGLFNRDNRSSRMKARDTLRQARTRNIARQAVARRRQRNSLANANTAAPKPTSTEPDTGMNPAFKAPPATPSTTPRKHARDLSTNRATISGKGGQGAEAAPKAPNRDFSMPKNAGTTTRDFRNSIVGRPARGLWRAGRRVGKYVADTFKQETTPRGRLSLD